MAHAHELSGCVARFVLRRPCFEGLKIFSEMVSKLHKTSVMSPASLSFENHDKAHDGGPIRCDCPGQNTVAALEKEGRLQIHEY